MNNRNSKFSGYIDIIWLYTKYQIITKGILFAVIFPLFSSLIKAIINSTGRVGVSSGDYIKFLLSFQGAGALVLTVALMILLIGTDINAFIIMSALIKEGRMKMTARSILFAGIKSLKLLISPSGLLIMLYVAMILPLMSVGFTISPMDGFQIPKFITGVIFGSPLYTLLYGVAIFGLLYISIRYIFTFHFILLSGKGIGDGLKASSKLMRGRYRRFIKDYFFKLIKLTLIFLIIIAIFIALLFGSASIFAKELLPARIVTTFSLLVLVQVFGFVGMMTVPVISGILTDIFYKYNEESGEGVKLCFNPFEYEINGDLSRKAWRAKVTVVGVVIALMFFNVIVSVFVGMNFDEIFSHIKKIEIVAHRGGGDLDAENTLEGLEAAIAKGADWSEIDVQRTFDGRYIINHDSTFSRLAGDSHAVPQLTLEQIKKLEVKNQFDESKPSRSVPTLEELMDCANGRIGLYIELKGKTADEKMVDDVVRMIKERGMESQAAVLSLDYELIKYTEEHYPEILTGYLYFFSVGDTEKLSGDILIMEEAQADSEIIEKIHGEGKKAVVWTVNTDDSVEKFVKSDVDGIITDYVEKVQQGMKLRDERTDAQIILDSIIGL